MRKLAMATAAVALLGIGFLAGNLFYQRRQAPALPTIEPAVPRIEPGERIVTFPEPVPGTPEPNPKLIVKATIRDAITGKPVETTQVVLDGKVIAENVSEFHFELPGVVEEHIFLEVHSPGYQLWKVGFRHKLTHSRIYELPVRLQPLPVTPIPEA